jgi:hypothetical protein
MPPSVLEVVHEVSGWNSPPKVLDAPAAIASTVHVPQEPPQSMLVSFWFCTPSLQVGTWHLPVVHTPLTQSEEPTHIFPVPHGGHVAPPQS